MNNQLNINLLKYKNMRTQIKCCAKKIVEANIGVDFGGYSNLNPNTRMKEVYEIQKVQTEDYFLQVEEDVQMMRKIVSEFESMDDYGALKIKATGAK